MKCRRRRTTFSFLPSLLLSDFPFYYYLSIHSLRLFVQLRLDDDDDDDNDVVTAVVSQKGGNFASSSSLVTYRCKGRTRRWWQEFHPPTNRFACAILVWSTWKLNRFIKKKINFYWMREREIDAHTTPSSLLFLYCYHRHMCVCVCVEERFLILLDRNRKGERRGGL